MSNSKSRVIWLYPRLTTWMGGTRFIFEALSLIAKDRPVLLVTQRQSKEIIQEFKNANIDTYNLNTPSFTEISFWIFFNQIIKKNISELKKILLRDDIIISSMFPMNFLAQHLKQYHIQILYEPFAMFYDRSFQKSISFPVQLFSRMVARLFSSKDIEAVKRSHQTLTLSEYEKSNIKRIYGNENVKVIYEGVDTSRFYPKKNAELALKYKDSKIVFHSTGFDSFKGTDLLISAIPLIFQKVKESKFLISYTRVNPSKLESYKHFLKEQKVDHCVEFLGLLDYELLPYYYTLAKVYVEPGIGRSMSFSSKEANACATPSIRGNIGTEDLIDGETGFLVSPYDKEELAEKIIILLENDSLAQQLGLNAQKMILEKYTWNSVVSKIVDCFPKEKKNDSSN